MIAIHDENRCRYVDVAEGRQDTADHIEGLLEDINKEKLHPEKRSALVDALLGFQDELDGLDEMLKIPFDVLIVVKKGKSKKKRRRRNRRSIRPPITCGSNCPPLPRSLIVPCRV